MHKIKPMLATLADGAFDSEDYVFEIKWDGYRALAEVEKGKVSLYSRNLNDFGSDYPSIVSALKKVKEDLLFDGEVVAYGSDDVPSFQSLQNIQKKSGTRIEYIIFDLIYYKGKDLTGIPLLERKEILKKVLEKYPAFTFSEHIEKNGIEFFKTAVKRNLEGIMAKRKDSHYLIGRRSDAWLKIKNHATDEALIAGFTEPRGSRSRFGALVLGQYRNNDELVFIGHTGTGFSQKGLEDLYKKMKPLTQKKSPFAAKVPLNAPITWIKPKLIAQLKFAEWTGGGHMRQPVFLGLRDDKSPKEVKKEKVVTVTKIKK